MDYIFQIMEPMMNLIWFPLAILIILLVSVILVYYFRIRKYKRSSYYANTKKGFFEVEGDAGSLGEYLVYDNMKSFERNGAKFLFNVYIPKEDGNTTELDAVMICEKGIFVFESKNYSGWIFGDENSSTWMQMLPTGKKATKKRFFNPIMQNRTHIKYLKQFLGEDLDCYSVVVFSDRCELKKVTYDCAKVTVTRCCTLEDRVREVYDSAESVMSEDKIEQIYERLYPYSQTTKEEKEEHIENIKKENSKNYCPRCKTTLVLRTVKKGERAGQQFYGCPNYPGCKYTKNL